MTPRYARLVGWLLLTGVVGTVFACATPTVEGTDIESNSAGSTARNKRTSSSSKTSGDDDDATAPAKTTTPKPSTSTTGSTTTPTTPTVPTTPGTNVAPPPTTTATTPPPVTQPSCQSGDPLACLDCCLNANPGAVSFENNYDSCMQGCNPGDNACLDDCQRSHVSACAANTSCSANHACMEANNCLAQNFCNPI